MKNNANFGQRLLAALIDDLLGWVVFLWYLVQLLSQSDTVGVLNVLLSAFLASIWYGIIFHLAQALLISKFGGSLGKLLTGIKIVNSEGKHLNFWQALFREMGLKNISRYFFGLGFFWMLKDKNNQTWHDQAADTHVVTTNQGLVFVGLLMLVSLIGINGYLVVEVVKVVEKNLPVYETISTELVKSFTEEFNKKDKKVSPTPFPTPGRMLRSGPEWEQYKKDYAEYQKNLQTD